MASKTDLDGFLYNDEGNVAEQLAAWLSGGDQKEPGQPPATPATLRLMYRAQGAQSFETMWEEKLQTLPATAEPILSKLRAVIVEKLGTNPTGQLRLRGWGRSQAASPGLDVQRTITLNEEWTDMALLRAELVEERRKNRELFEIVKELSMGSMAMANAHAGSLAQLATVRAGGAAAADSSGVGGLLGLMGIVMFKPHLDAVLRGEPNSIATFGDRLMRRLAGDDTTPNEEQIRQVLADPGSVEVIQRLLERDPDLVARVGELLKGAVERDPALVGRLLSGPTEPVKPPARAVAREDEEKAA